MEMALRLGRKARAIRGGSSRAARVITEGIVSWVGVEELSKRQVLDSWAR